MVDEARSVLPDALARETLHLPNAEAWTVMQMRLFAAGVKRVAAVRDEAWRIRKTLLAKLRNGSG